jgi:hypothetical protein
LQGAISKVLDLCGLLHLLQIRLFLHHCAV